MSATEGLGLPALNALPAAEAEVSLKRCCSSVRWARAVVAGRPYSSPEELYDAADAALESLGEADVDEALSGHPRIGERPSGEDGAWSRREQRGLAGARDEALAAIAEGNRAYEERFGHVYLVCANGRNADELLALLQRRLDNDPTTERQVVRHELGKINRIRLRRLLDAEGTR